jgi:hypothetical protein
LNAVITSAFCTRNRIRSYAIYRRWYDRDAVLTARVKRGIIDGFGWLAQPGFIFRMLVGLYDAIYRYEHSFEAIRNQLKRIDPDLVWSTVNVDPVYERAYVSVSKELGIPLVNSVLSFDNLTSKPVQLVYDHYFVWSGRMKAELLRFFPAVDRADVTVTGTPQFDFHCKPEFRIPRDDTLHELGVSRGAGYFLYSCSHQDLAPDEPALVVELARRMANHPRLRDTWLVVRTHPLDDWGRWAFVPGEADRVALSHAWSVEPDNEGWAAVEQMEQARLISTLAHAAACINIASTISLDAAILDRPVIGIRFDGLADAPHGILYEEYEADHYAPLVRSGGLRIANTWGELFALLETAITEPGRDAAERARMVAEECGQVDGLAALRVSAGLLHLLAGAARG